MEIRVWGHSDDVIVASVGSRLEEVPAHDHMRACIEHRDGRMCVVDFRYTCDGRWACTPVGGQGVYTTERREGTDVAVFADAVSVCVGVVCF